MLNRANLKGAATMASPAISFPPNTAQRWTLAASLASVLAVVVLFCTTVVVVLIAENTGHIKAVASMTGRDLDRDGTGTIRATLDNIGARFSFRL